MPLFNLLIPLCNILQEFRIIHYFVDYIADACVVVLRNLVKTGLVCHKLFALCSNLISTSNFVHLSCCAVTVVGFRS